jgi:hypothetical protein
VITRTSQNLRPPERPASILAIKLKAALEAKKQRQPEQVE